jgi:hypothetical protein
MTYNMTADVNWSSRFFSATISSDSSQQVTGLYVALADSQGNWLTWPQETLSGSHTGMSYMSIDFTPFGYQPHAFCFSGRTDQFQFESGVTYTQQNTDEANGRPANLNAPLHQNFLSATDNFYNKREILFKHGSRNFVKQVSTVTGAQNLITVTATGVAGSRGDYLEHSGDFYRILTGIAAGGNDEMILDRNTSNISVNDWVAVYQTAIITGYDAISGAIKHTDVTFSGSSWTTGAAAGAGYSHADLGGAYRSIAVYNTGAIPEYTDVEVGDVFLYTPDNGTKTYSGYIVSTGPYTLSSGTLAPTSALAGRGEFVIITGGQGGYPDSGIYAVSKMDQYFIDLGPQPDTAMMAVLLSGTHQESGNILHTHSISPDQSYLEINFNEYDSSVASVGTKAHFHVGPVVIGGHTMTGGTSSMSANLYGGDRTLKETWALASLDNYFNASSNTGQFYDELIGSYSVNTTESFAQSDMLYFRAAIIVNGRKVERGITIASQPVV